MTRIHQLSTTHGLTVLSVSDFQDKGLIARIEDGRFPQIDLIISCGDLAPEYLTFLKDRLGCPLFYVKGNHDIRYTPSNMVGCENIHGRVVQKGSLNILGIEGSMWYNGGPNQYTESQMKKILFWTGIRNWTKKPVHMVVTHAPPRHIHDREDLCHMGFKSFKRLMNKRKPDLFIHGHIHDEFKAVEDRITIINTTRVINTCGHMIFEV